MYHYDAYADQQRRERERDVEKMQAAEKREREREHQRLLAEREKTIAARIERNLDEIRRRREEREAAKIQQEHDRQDRIMARIDEAYPDRPYGRRGAGHGDPVAAWKQAVDVALRACGGNRQRAVSLANTRNPGLRQRMLDVVNSGRTR